MTYEFIASPNKSSRKGNKAAGLLGHFTAGGSLNGTVRWFANRVKAPDSSKGKGIVERDGKKYYNSRASTHYVTGRPNKNRKVRTVQMVSEAEAAWHAGSRTTKPQLNGRGSLNLWTIGHEICNWGPLFKGKDGIFYTNFAGFSHRYKGPEPVRVEKDYGEVGKSYRFVTGSQVFPTGTIEFWEPYTDEQIDDVIILWRDIIARYQFTRSQVAGHEEVDPTRKCDPGPAFPWDDVLSACFPGTIALSNNSGIERERIITAEPVESDLLARADDEDEDYEVNMSIRNDSDRNTVGLCALLVSKFLK